MPNYPQRRSFPFKNPWDDPDYDPQRDFDPDKLKNGWIELGPETIVARIPNVPGRISRRKTQKDDYIEFIVERSYDREKRQTRNKKVIIGTDFSHIFPGMMIVNECYHDYFTNQGVLVFDPMKKKKAGKATEQGPADPENPQNPEESNKGQETPDEEAPNPEYYWDEEPDEKTPDAGEPKAESRNENNKL